MTPVYSSHVESLFCGSMLHRLCMPCFQQDSQDAAIPADKFLLSTAQTIACHQLLLSTPSGNLACQFLLLACQLLQVQEAMQWLTWGGSTPSSWMDSI